MGVLCRHPSQRESVGSPLHQGHTATIGPGSPRRRIAAVARTRCVHTGLARDGSGPSATQPAVAAPKWSPLSAAFFVVLVLMVVVYLTLVEMRKGWFFRPQAAPDACAVREENDARTAAPPAGAMSGLPSNKDTRSMVAVQGTPAAVLHEQSRS